MNHRPVFHTDSTSNILYRLILSRLLRSVSYGEFTRLVYGKLGNKRIPLPACAYDAIRATFAGDDPMTGFIEEDVLE